MLSEVGEAEFWAEGYYNLAAMYLARDPFSSATPLQLLGNAITALSKQDDEWPNFG